MPAVCRKGDMNSGPSGLDTVISGSSNVFINNKPVVRVGDKDIGPLGIDTLVSGSPTVFINNKPVVRVGDSDSAGDKMISGSGNVFN
jgi:uncharacterized Zn-binding protein involved in type VI secretion